MPDMMIVPYDRKPFFVANDTTRPEKTDGGIEKRIVNEIVAEDRRWNFVVDCYAGFGISTLIFAKHAKIVYAVEKNLKYASAMWINLRPYFFDNVIGRVVIIPKDNRDYLRVAPDEEEHPPDLIDLDPFASCGKQLELAMEWMENGALLLTNGHIGRILRKMSWVKKTYPDMRKRGESNRLAHRVFYS